MLCLVTAINDDIIQVYEDEVQFCQQAVDELLKYLTRIVQTKRPEGGEDLHFG
jgi:hypothetical protein